MQILMIPLNHKVKQLFIQEKVSGCLIHSKGLQDYSSGLKRTNKSKTKIKFLSYPLKGKSQPIESDSCLDRVELEDQEVILNVQRGIQSIVYKSGRYSPKYEKGLHHFHRLLAEFLNS